MFKYDLHVHSSECSLCAVSNITEMIDAYKAADYAGIVLTNHFISGNTSLDKTMPWCEMMKIYTDTVENARQYAKEKDFDLLFGIEHHYGNGKEVLIYGIDYNFLCENDDFLQISLSELADRVHNYGAVIVHAHPFRDRDYINIDVMPDFSVCDGIEVYNASNMWQENEKAFTSSEELGLFQISASDCHDAKSSIIGKAGMAFSERIVDSRQLVDALLEGKGRLIIEGNIE